MAAKKGNAKLGTGMRSKKLSADQAGQVKGGAPSSIKGTVGHKDLTSWKLIGNGVDFKRD